MQDRPWAHRVPRRTRKNGTSDDAEAPLRRVARPAARIPPRARLGHGRPARGGAGRRRDRAPTRGRGRSQTKAAMASGSEPAAIEGGPGNPAPATRRRLGRPRKAATGEQLAPALELEAEDKSAPLSEEAVRSELRRQQAPPARPRASLGAGPRPASRAARPRCRYRAGEAAVPPGRGAQARAGARPQPGQAAGERRSTHEGREPARAAGARRSGWTRTTIRMGHRQYR